MKCNRINCDFKMKEYEKYCIEYAAEVYALQRFIFGEWDRGRVPVHFVFCVPEDLNDFIAGERNAGDEFEVCITSPSGRPNSVFHYCEHSQEGSRIFNDCLPWAEPGAASGSLITPEGDMVTFKGRQPMLKRVSKRVVLAGLERGRYLYDQLVPDTLAKIENGLCPCETTPIRAF